jgi:hypothetical protein
MRVIAGKFRSRTLQSLPGRETRPTYDRLKETLFNVLVSAGKVSGCAWADLYAGTGSIGIEALSRGAASVHFAESGAAAAPECNSMSAFSIRPTPRTAPTRRFCARSRAAPRWPPEPSWWPSTTNASIPAMAQTLCTASGS